MFFTLFNKYVVAIGLLLYNHSIATYDQYRSSKALRQTTST